MDTENDMVFIILILVENYADDGQQRPLLTNATFPHWFVHFSFLPNSSRQTSRKASNRLDEVN